MPVSYLLLMGKFFTNNNRIMNQSILCYGVCIKLPRKVAFFRCKTSFTKTLSEIIPIPSNMILLPEVFLSALCRSNRWIFISGFTFHVDGDLENGPSAGFENAEQLPYGQAVVRDVFKDVGAEYDVECVVLEVYIRDVHLHHRQGRGDIGADVVEVGEPLERFLEDRFGCHMQDT